MKIPKPTDQIVKLIDDAWVARAASEQHREYFGISQIGHHCQRYLWLNFRWAIREKFDGRMLRLFDRGHREEASIVANLRAIGIDVQNTGSQQSRVSFPWHIRGHMDGLAPYGIPGISKKPHVFEFKTHNKKSFDELQRDGLRKSKPMHFSQLQCYMYGAKVERGLYVAVCKDDDRLYTERIELDREFAEKLIERAKNIVQMEEAPPPISTDPSWYQCKMCTAHAMCHQQQPTKQINCRTCAHSTVRETDWRCERHDADDIPVEFQRQGCEAHVLHPSMVPWERKASNDQWEAIYVIDGKDVRNGEGDAFVFASSEIVANPSECANPQAVTQELRETMGGKIVDFSDEEIPF